MEFKYFHGLNDELHLKSVFSACFATNDNKWEIHRKCLHIFHLSQGLGLRETFMKIMILSLMQEVKESWIDLYWVLVPTFAVLAQSMGIVKVQSFWQHGIYTVLDGVLWGTQQNRVVLNVLVCCTAGVPQSRPCPDQDNACCCTGLNLVKISSLEAVCCL